MGLAGEGGGRRGGLGVWFETKGDDSTKGTETDFVITAALSQPPAPPPEGSLRQHISKLLYATTTDTLRDITEVKKGFPIRNGMVRKHGKIRMLTTHRDAHIYLFPYWVLEMIKCNERFDSISEDVVGWWAKASWQDGLAQKLQLDQIFDPLNSETAKEGESGSHASGNVEDEIDLASMCSTCTSTLRAPITKPPTTTPRIVKPPLTTIPPMLSYVHPTTTTTTTGNNNRIPTPLIRRVDTPHLLLHTCLRLASLPPLTDPSSTPHSHPAKISPEASIAPHTNIQAATTLIAPNTTIATHAVIKTSVVGANCEIGEGVRLTGCLLMDGAVVREKCVLQGCIVGRRAMVEVGCSLRDCEVQEGYRVAEKTEGKGEKFMVFEGLEDAGEDGEGEDDGLVGGDED